jgi:hypothetical protein
LKTEKTKILNETETETETKTLNETKTKTETKTLNETENWKRPYQINR